MPLPNHLGGAALSRPRSLPTLATRLFPIPCSSHTSMELGLEKDLAAFCSQECFKGSWTEHKKLHKPSATEGWHYCTRRGQVRQQSRSCGCLLDCT